MMDRNEMLKAYLNCRLLKQLSDLTEAQIQEVSFSSQSPDPLIEALKRLIFSYCQSDADITVRRNVNREIEQAVNDGKQ
ncbi:MAG: hypothetical protein OXC62_13205 [Aestuariivita sp.]|nr:hypothetical protein [Aestuariivita sp.]